MSFSLSFENKNLVEVILQKYYEEKLLDIILEKTNIVAFCNNVPDLARQYRLKKSLFFEFDPENYNQELYYNAERIFDATTDNVLRMEVPDIEYGFEYIYNNYISKALNIKDLYGVVGVDKKSNEVINFSNPFRVASLIKNPRRMKLNALFIYKKPDAIKGKYTLLPEEKELVRTMFQTVLIAYIKGLEDNKSINIKSYISLEKSNRIEDSFHIYKYSKIENDNVQYNSFIYFSDILLFNTFMPHYAIMNLNIVKGKLLGRYFKHIPMFSPNVNLYGNVCTGNLPNVSKEGFECLKISNLGSPFFKTLFEKKTTEYFIDLNIAQAKALYKKEFNINQEAIG